jgi:hypothetical protein
MINQEDGNPSWQAFLIDLDLVVRDKREGPLGARVRQAQEHSWQLAYYMTMRNTLSCMI